jgi:hypothetical protein
LSESAQLRSELERVTQALLHAVDALAGDPNEQLYVQLEEVATKLRRHEVP